MRLRLTTIIVIFGCMLYITTCKPYILPDVPLKTTSDLYGSYYDYEFNYVSIIPDSLMLNNQEYSYKITDVFPLITFNVYEHDVLMYQGKLNIDGSLSLMDTITQINTIYYKSKLKQDEYKNFNHGSSSLYYRYD